MGKKKKERKKKVLALFLIPPLTYGIVRGGKVYKSMFSRSFQIILIRSFLAVLSRTKWQGHITAHMTFNP